jgi:hypothetical protein
MATSSSTLQRANYISADVNTAVRGLIALVVIWVSYKLTRSGATSISQEWAAILIIVVGYYFKDRPIEESLQSTPNTTDADLRGLWFEIVVQFALALALIGFTILAFAMTGATEISGEWVGAVVLAVGFYFKDPRTEVQGVHNLFQTLIAASVALLTLVFVSPRLYSTAPKVPLQWVGIVLIVVAFYFKQRLTR